jgi:hypothetical protein
MSDDLKRFESKLDRIDERMNSVDVTLAKQSEILDIHVKRTNMLEDSIKPIQRRVAMIDGAVKLLGLLGIVAAIVEAIALVVKH